MGSISINGKSYTGNNVKVVNSVVFIDGKRVDGDDQKVINIVVNGYIEDLTVDACNKVEVKGSVKYVNTTSGDVDITGDVLGSINCTSGDISCGNVSGSVKTISGDIKYKR